MFVCVVWWFDDKEWEYFLIKNARKMDGMIISEERLRNYYGVLVGRGLG